ncbi:MAG: SDR family NAD(P)-dependent oxidoreductase, partial [Candidatus Thorarchaeota archaeon]
MPEEISAKSGQKRIVITGASSGIGEAVALDMARDGHIFFLIGRNESRLEKVKEDVQNAG